MDTPAAKRQLLTAANLAKPFRSPLKRRPIDCEPKNDGASGLKRSGLHHTTSSDTTPLPRKLPRTTFNSPSITASFNADPDIAHLIKAQRQLEKQLREVKDELDEARQARKIESDSTKQDPYGEVDGELKALKQKWKEASRLAAEDLFTDVRDRVNRMGGPKAWKEMQERQKLFRQGYDEEPERRPKVDSENEDAAEEVEERDLYAEYGEPETENEKEARGGNDIDEDEADDEFTMSMMLRTLNVPLDVIGYDRGEQRWNT